MTHNATQVLFIPKTEEQGGGEAKARRRDGWCD